MSCVSFQSHRFLFHSCTQDFPVAFTLTMMHRFSATRANVSCASSDRHQRLFIPFSYLVVFSRWRDSGIVWNSCFRQVGLALIRIPHVVSSCETHLIAQTSSIRLRRDNWWWDRQTVVGGGATRVLWSGRAIGIQGYEAKEENPQTWWRGSIRSAADNEAAPQSQR